MKQDKTKNQHSKNHKSNHNEPDVSTPLEENENNESKTDSTVVEDSDLKNQLEEKQKQCDEIQDKYIRSLAEFDNFRKRTMKEKSAMYDDGARSVVEKLLPIIDNFERALGSVSDKGDSFYIGVEMIFKQMEAVFAEIGVEVIPTEGEFDTDLHFAVSHVEDESFGENEIAEELQKGYKYKDKVIRPSMVKVAN